MKKILLMLSILSNLAFANFVKDSDGVISYTNENGVSCYYVNEETAHTKDYNLWVQIPNWESFSGSYKIRCFDDKCKNNEEIKATGIYNSYLNVHMLKVTPEILELLKTHEEVYISNFDKTRGMLVKLKNFNKMYDQVIKR